MTAATHPGPSVRPAAWPASGHIRIAIIGAGFGGLAVAHSLRRAGIEEFVILDRGQSVGGTWRDNTYPGCGCDIASNLYSFSFAPNPQWSRSYSRQPEIHDYLKKVAHDQDLERFLVLGIEVGAAHWEDEQAQWRLQTSAGELTADILVGATGPLSAPKIPDVPGLEQFPGPVFHTAQWRHDVSLTGQRVGVVGTGASAVQVIPVIQPDVGHLTIFQRTPPWIIMKGDRNLSALEHAVYQRFPFLQRMARAGNYAFREGQVAGFVVQPAIMRIAEQASKALIRRQVKDPALRAKLQPSYRLGCKRVLPANEYYPTLNQPNVDLVASAITRFEGSTAVAADGSRHDLDVVIFGTGFEVADLPVGHHLFGKDGRSLAAHWAQEGRSALRMTTVAGFPNLFMVLGPNSGLGHNSMVYVIESQAAYIVDAIKQMTVGRLAAIEPQPQVQRQYNATLQRRMKRTVWVTGGCASWYQDADGTVTSLWPGSTLRLRQNTRRADLSEYQQRPTGKTRRAEPASHASPAGNAGHAGPAGNASHVRPAGHAGKAGKAGHAGYDRLTPPPPRERFDVHSADGTRLNVEVFGTPTGPTVVLAHGWTCSIVFWARQLNALAPHYRVVAYDQRGHGASGEPGPAGCTATAIADDLAAVLAAAAPHGEKVVLAGHSMGAMATIALAQRHPEVVRDRIAAALLASTGMSELMVRSTIVPLPLPLATAIAPISAAVIGITPPGRGVTAGMRAMIKYASLSRSASPAEVDFAARVVAACPPRTRSAFAKMLAGLNLDDAVSQLDVPTIVVAGARDRLTPIWHARRMAASLPQLQELIEIEDAGHMTPIQSGDQVNAALIDLIETHRQTVDLTTAVTADSHQRDDAGSSVGVVPGPGSV